VAGGGGLLLDVLHEVVGRPRVEPVLVPQAVDGGAAPPEPEPPLLPPLRRLRRTATRMPTMTTAAAMPPIRRRLPEEDFFFFFLAWVVLSLSSDPAAEFVEVEDPLRSGPCLGPLGMSMVRAVPGRAMP
jgi:hypothetical protein